jgi:AraC-like DNA-binding protein
MPGEYSRPERRRILRAVAWGCGHPVSTLVRLEDRPVDERMDFLREMSARLWVPMDFAGDDSPRAEFRVSGFGPLQVVVLDVTPLTVSRTSQHIEQADPDLLKAYVSRGGTSVITQDGRRAEMRPGDLTFYDTQRPYEGIIGTEPGQLVRGMTFMFPPSMLPLSRSRISELTATRIPATSGLGELTSQFLLQLARNVDHYTAAEAARLSTAALEVLATRLARVLEIRDWGTLETRQHAMLTTIQAFICQHLGDPGLSPAAVATAHHMSLRSLHQLFHDEGLTVAGWIRARRMERCRRDLSDPLLESQPVAAIAIRWGFSSAADFSRAFRAAHGMPPAEYRRSARIGKQPAL